MNTTAELDIPSIVRRCCDAYTRTLAAERAKGSDHFDSHEQASAAYLTAMPYLGERDEIRAFIACVTHAMILGVLTTPRGTKLLYAAQVALGALPREPRLPAGRPSKSPPPPQAEPAPPCAECPARAAVAAPCKSSAAPVSSSPEKNTPTPSPRHPIPCRNNHVGEPQNEPQPSASQTAPADSLVPCP